MMLEPTGDLFRSPSLTSDMVNVIRDEAIAIWEPAQRTGRTRGLWIVSVESWEKGGDKQVRVGRLELANLL